VQGIPPKDIELRVEEQLDAVRLLAWKKRMPHELSGGMQQRIGLARALITDSPILLMDEPFSALDPLIRAQLQDDLLELNQRLQKTILFISHDMDEALRLGQRIAIMQEGEILQLDSARNLICNPQHDAVKQFLEHANPLKSLTVKDLMVGADAYPEFKASELQSVFHDSTLHLAMKKLHSSDQPLRVVNKDHKTLGLLAMQDIISGLVK
jgi:glycine betaine/proline transport system ATP-binding protein